ncbi:MAG: FapA family protein, partial [Proteobacteria bacterium]|nr:FapA family protein [Pseudomonadota bacterium]
MVTLKAKNKAEKESIDLLELAVNCKMITNEQEEQLLQEIFKHTQKNPKVSVARSLYQHKILEKDQIEFLFAIKKHIDMLMLDKKFGRLGVANEFVCQESIDKAMTIQVDIFKKQKKSVKIGDILAQKKEITEANKTAILLTQDRIRDEYLADAINAIATNEMERSAINKRFGAIAVKKELITTEQLNQALKAQKKEEKEKGEKRYLGEILKELFNLTEKDTIKILKIQKTLETKRMNLQKKVFSFNAEKESVKLLNQFLTLQVSEDKLAAFVIQKKGDAPQIDSGDVINWLANAGIKYGVRTKKEIQVFFESPKPGKKFKIAQGLAPIETKKEQIQFVFDKNTIEDPAESENDAQVKKDDVIATVIPFEAGTPGKDVFGHPIAIEQDDAVMLSSGEGVARSNNDFIALIDGILRVYKNRTLFVIPVKTCVETKEIEGDISEATQDQYLDCDLNVSGNISPGATVVCHGLTVKGDALGNISATSDVEIQGNIGDGKDVENAQPSIQITTHGQLKVNGKKICAQIITDKGLSAPHADVVNSRIFSSGDVVVKNIQSSKSTPSVIWIAMKHTLELQKLKKAIKEEQKKLDEFTHKKEIDALSKKLMEQVQVQQNYLENQNVLSYLMKVMDHVEFKDLEPIGKKIDAYDNKKAAQSENQEQIPKNTKAYKFFEKIVDRLKSVEQKNQEQYV